MPTVSVIVATFRRDLALQRALESIAKQTYNDLEIIITDDNDHATWNQKVQSIVEAFRNKYPMISVNYIQNHSNLGSARARNEGIKVANGEYICFLDDDDIYCPPRIENQLIPMKEAMADYSVTNLELYSESEKLLETRNREYIKETTSDMLLKYHLMHHITGTDTMMFRREYLLKIGGFSPIDVGDEFYLMQKAIESDGKFLHVPVCDVKAYVHTGEGGLSSGQGKIDGENRLYTHKKKYFNQLDKKSIRFIKMRHYAVIAFAELRRKKYAAFFANAFHSFCIAPFSCLKMLSQR